VIRRPGNATAHLPWQAVPHDRSGVSTWLGGGRAPSLRQGGAWGLLGTAGPWPDGHSRGSGRGGGGAWALWPRQARPGASPRRCSHGVQMPGHRTSPTSPAYPRKGQRDRSPCSTVTRHERNRPCHHALFTTPPRAGWGCPRVCFALGDVRPGRVVCGPSHCRHLSADCNAAYGRVSRALRAGTRSTPSIAASCISAVDGTGLGARRLRCDAGLIFWRRPLCRASDQG